MKADVFYGLFFFSLSAYLLPRRSRYLKQNVESIFFVISMNDKITEQNENVSQSMIRPFVHTVELQWREP